MPLSQADEFVQINSEFLGALASGLTGGNKPPPSAKGKIGGIRINAIDANVTESCHKAEFKGGTKGKHNGVNGGGKFESKSKSGPAKAQPQSGGMMMVPMTVPSMMYPYQQQMMVPMMAAGSSGDTNSNQNPSNVMGNMESFFGGSFFVQKLASHVDEIESILPQVE